MEDKNREILNDIKAELVSNIYELRSIKNGDKVDYFRTVNESKLDTLLMIIKAELHAEGFETFDITQNDVDYKNRKSQEGKA